MYTVTHTDDIWKDGNTMYTVTHTDVIGKLEPPGVRMEGHSLYYIFSGEYGFNG